MNNPNAAFEKARDMLTDYIAKDQSIRIDYDHHPVIVEFDQAVAALQSQPDKGDDAGVDAPEYYNADSLSDHEREIYNAIRPSFMLAAKTWARDDKEYTAAKIGANRAVIKLIKTGWINLLKTNPRQPVPEGEIEYTPGKWFVVKDVKSMRDFYLSRLPAIREAARKLGYAIGLHGSTNRDFDLIATPWIDDPKSRFDLVKAVQFAACGFTQQKYEWALRPHGRMATAFPICWAEWDGCHDVASLGHIDLSVCPSEMTQSAPTPAVTYKAEVEKLEEARGMLESIISGDAKDNGGQTLTGKRLKTWYTKYGDLFTDRAHFETIRGGGNDVRHSKVSEECFKTSS